MRDRVREDCSLRRADSYRRRVLTSSGTRATVAPVGPKDIRTNKEMVHMVYAFMQDVPIDEPRYREVIAALGSEPVDGCLLHMCVRREDGGLRYIDIWRSEAECARAFDERIHDAVD